MIGIVDLSRYSFSKINPPTRPIIDMRYINAAPRTVLIKIAGTEVGRTKRSSGRRNECVIPQHMPGLMREDREQGHYWRVGGGRWELRGVGPIPGVGVEPLQDRLKP